MVELIVSEQTIESELEGANFNCPACDEVVNVIVVTKVKPGTVRKAGSDGFAKQRYSVNVKSEIVRFYIHHECEPRYKEGATNG